MSSPKISKIYLKFPAMVSLKYRLKPKIHFKNDSIGFNLNKYESLSERNSKYYLINTPSSSRIKYGTNQLRNQLNNYSENTRSLAYDYPNIQKYKFLNIETYDNYPIRYREDENPFNEGINYNYNYDENIDYNESPSMLENTNRKSPYFFNVPK